MSVQLNDVELKNTMSYLTRKWAPQDVLDAELPGYYPTNHANPPVVGHWDALFHQVMILPCECDSWSVTWSAVMTTGVGGQ